MLTVPALALSLTRAFGNVPRTRVLSRSGGASPSPPGEPDQGGNDCDDQHPENENDHTPPVKFHSRTIPRCGERAARG